MQNLTSNPLFLLFLVAVALIFVLQAIMAMGRGILHRGNPAADPSDVIRRSMGWTRALLMAVLWSLPVGLLHNRFYQLVPQRTARLIIGGLWGVIGIIVLMYIF